MTKNNLYISLLTILIYLSFFFGYFFQENSAGGGFIDFQYISNNILLFKESNFFEINWMKYESTSLPIYYLIIKTQNIFGFFKIGFFNLVISFSSVFIFFKILLNLIKKYNFEINNNFI